MYRRHRSVRVCSVAYLAAELVSTLRRNQPELDITDTDLVCVSLAGLCHDLGHGPFSHMWETFMAQVRPERDWKVRVRRRAELHWPSCWSVENIQTAWLEEPCQDEKRAYRQL